MAEILHLLECTKPCKNNGRNYLSTGAGFKPSTGVPVSIHTGGHYITNPNNALREIPQDYRFFLNPPKTGWPLVGNEGMNPQYTNVKVDSLIPY